MPSSAVLGPRRPRSFAESMRRPDSSYVIRFLNLRVVDLLSLTLVACVSSGFNVAFSNMGGARYSRNSRSTSLGPANSVGLDATPVQPTMVATDSVAKLLKTVSVDLGDRSYPIYIGTGLLERCAVVCYCGGFKRFDTAAETADQRVSGDVSCSPVVPRRGC